MGRALNCKWSLCIKVSLTASASFSCLSSSICTSLCFLFSRSSASLRLVSNSRACCKRPEENAAHPEWFPVIHPLVISHLYNALDFQILVLPSLQPLGLLEVRVVWLAAATATATAGAAAALPLTVFSLDASLLLEFVMKGQLAFALETECCLNSFVKQPIRKFRQTECVWHVFDCKLISIPKYCFFPLKLYLQILYYFYCMALFN